ncbi:MAG: hypothetical protein WCI12_08255, partial [Actinomycetes bacterium]
MTKSVSVGRWMTPKRIPAFVAGILGVVLLVIAFANADQTQAIALGLGGGALIAAIALSVTLNYQGSGVVNFAAGAVAMYGGYVYYGLRVNGQLFLPPIPNPLAPIEGLVHLLGSKSFSLPHIPVFITIAHPSQGTAAYGTVIQQPALPVWAALLISLGVLTLLGLAFHFLIFRPLRKAPVLARVVASVGLFIVMQAVIVLRFTSSAKAVAPILPSSPVHLPRGVSLPADQLFLVLI